MIVVWLSAIPLSVVKIIVVPCLLCRGCIVGGRSCALPVVFTQILSGDSLCEKSCVDDLVKILLCEGGDVELGARTWKHIFVFVFDPLSQTLSLSLILCLASFILLTYMLGIVVCVPYLC